MQGQDWMDLIEKIPVQQRDGLGLITTSGVSIQITSIMRAEDNYFVLRGRLMGTTDAGQTFFVPYRQIDCLVFQRILKEPEIQAWFGGGGLPLTAEGAAPAMAAAGAEEAESEKTPAAAQAQPLATAPPQMTPGALPGHKAAILDRLRRRTGSAPGIVKKPGLGPAQGNPPKPPEKQ
jgi:hypothetical protein